MSNRVASGDVTQERLDELALGRLNPKTGKRKGGFIGSVRAMKQNQESLAIGDINEDDLIEMAYRQAWNYLKREAERKNETVDTADEEDAEYAIEQERRYREEYDWDESNANDDAGLVMLIELEVQSRRLKRELNKSGIAWKERTELLGELRNIAKDHAVLQKSLQIDRATRDNRSRTEDTMEALRTQIRLGADKVRQLREEWAEVAPECKTIEELVARAQHHSGMPAEWVLATLAAHRRLLGVDSTGVVVE